MSAMRHWIGIASRDHVMRGVAGGFAQLGHGKRAPLARLGDGDWLIYYAPRERMGEGDPVQAFVAIGRIVGDAPDQPDAGAESPTHPWRRRVDFHQHADDAPIRPLLDRLHLTADKGSHWGMVFRRSLIAIDAHDFALIATAMGVTP